MPVAATGVASRGVFGVLNLPTEVVSSEFLTFGDRQFSTSRGHVIYVRDVLEKLRPRRDPLLHLRGRPGEPGQRPSPGADFVQRNNSELVAGWGNLVSRTAAMVAKNFGEIPQPGPLEDIDEEVLADTVTGRSPPSARCWSAAGQGRACRGRCGSSVRPTPTSRAPSPSSSRVTTSASGWPRCCTP
jgi:methionyl-tRNA synthetase